MPVFLLATDLRPQDEDWPAAASQLDSLRNACARVLGFDPDVRLACMPGHPGDAGPVASLAAGIDEAAGRGETEIFVFPAALDFSLWQREILGQLLAEARRRYPGLAIHHDDLDLAHPLLVDAFASQAASALAAIEVPAQRAGLLLISSGQGDPASRAQTYRLMRLLWEQLGLAQADVAFVRNAQPFLLHALNRCATTPLAWVLLPQAQWETEHVEYARVILENFQRSAADPRQFCFVAAPRAHDLLTAYHAQRITRLWQEKRHRDAVRMRSARSAAPALAADVWSRGCGCIARVTGGKSLATVLEAILPASRAERVLVKVTWHGYATGTYTDPAALDLLLGALPAPAVILEGHTSSRNLGGAAFDWETGARNHRAWIRQQEAEYLRRTGLAEVLAQHKAQYVNVTEAFWDEDCVPREEIEGHLAQQHAPLEHPELAAFVPRLLMQFQGCPLISFAKFKGPTRLGISNMFGLIPHPLRSAWHGPNVTWFARVCCDLARLYGSLFDLYGVVEAMFSAAQWNRRGMYRSRWGNYDLNLNAGYITASRGLVSADILASRLQGQDVSRSSFFDVVRLKLGWDGEAAIEPLPEETRTVFA